MKESTNESSRKKNNSTIEFNIFLKKNLIVDLFKKYDYLFNVNKHLNQL